MQQLYKLKHTTDETKDCYVGSTKDMKSRMCSHQNKCKNGKEQQKLYGYIRDNGGMDAWSFEVLEEQEFKNQYDRFKREAELIDIHKARLNTVTPSASMFNPKDKRRQVCGRCGRVMNMFNSISTWKQHHKTKQCQNAQHEWKQHIFTIHPFEIIITVAYHVIAQWFENISPNLYQILI